MTRLLPILLVFFWAAPAAHGWVQVETDSGLPAYWAEGQLSFSISDALPDGWDKDTVALIIQKAVQPWTEIACFSFEVIDQEYASGAVRSAEDGVNWIIWQKSNWEFSKSLLAVTLVEYLQKTGEILDADILVNTADKDFSVALACDAQSAFYDLQAVLTHEFGHVVGLDHTLTPLATMDGATEPGDCKKRSLHQDDIDGFCQTYTQLPEPDPDPELVSETDGDAVGSVEPIEAQAEESDCEPGCRANGTDSGFPWMFMVLVLLLIRGRMARTA